MFAPIAPLKRAASRARSTLRDSIDATEHLAEEVNGDTDETEPEDLDPRQAQHKLQDEYEPLMRGRGGRARAGSTRSRASSASIASVLTGTDMGEPTKVKTRRLEIAVTYVIFFILGAGILLPWNALIVANTYFHSRLIGSPFEASFASWVALGFCTSNLVFLAIATFTQSNNTIGRRISSSILLMGLVFAVLIATTRFDTIPTGAFFALLLLSTATLAVAASYLQNAVVALSSRFGPIYLQGILSGQGAIALVVALIQFFAAYSTVATEAQSAMTVANPPSTEKGRNAAFAFFLTIVVFCAISLLSLLLLVKLPMYRLVIKSGSPVSTPARDDASSFLSSNGKQRQGDSPSLWRVERKVRHLGLAIAYIFMVTLAVFPSITSSILSVHDTNGPLGKLTTIELWVPAVFCLFAAGDWIGRAMPQWNKLTFKNWKILALLSVLRTVFVPLFLMCNVQTGFDNVKKPILNSDTVFLLIMLLFAVSNGYVSTLIMLAAVAEPSLDEEEIDIAATCLAFYLTAGLAIGSFISFPVRAAVCQCNPFS